MTTGVTTTNVLSDFYDISLNKFKDLIDYDDSIETPLAIANGYEQQVVEGRIPDQPMTFAGVTLNSETMLVVGIGVSVLAYLLLTK